jgi:predicted lactoylglutathione lyase
MELGAFSLSLNVKDIYKSVAFYKSLGFVELGGDIENDWIILKQGEHVIGLFQDMFEDNILTFNPGYNQQGETLQSFEDIRSIYKKIKAQGILIDSKIETKEGPASFMIEDPDGNKILFDQHI